MSEEYREHERDFTEEHYRELLRLARGRYRFAAFTDGATEERSVLWRHDLDTSPQRARALARMEAEENVRATYFVLLHSTFYNALEAEVVAIFKEIAALGHDIGLHFDPSHGEGDLEGSLAFERQILERTLGVTIRAFSWHNPSTGDWIETAKQDVLAGMVNAYGRSIQERYSYLSDSHGVWRYRRLHDVLAAGEETRLHVLTHPEWWVPEPMPPRARITRATAGRAAKTEQTYDATIAAMGRPNVR